MNPNSIFTSRDRKQPTNPHARKLDVDADLKPLLAFLQGEAGMSQEQVAKVRCGCLPLLIQRARACNCWLLGSSSSPVDSKQVAKMRPAAVRRMSSLPSYLRLLCADGIEGQHRGGLGCLRSARGGWDASPALSLRHPAPAACPAVRADHLGAPSAAQLLGARPAAALLCLPDRRAGPVATGGATACGLAGRELSLRPGVRYHCANCFPGSRHRHPLQPPLAVVLCTVPTHAKSPTITCYRTPHPAGGSLCGAAAANPAGRRGEGGGRHPCCLTHQAWLNVAPRQHVVLARSLGAMPACT